MSTVRISSGKALFQAAATLGFGFFLSRNVDFSVGFESALAGADWRWLSAAFITYGFVEVFAALRWQVLLRSRGLPLTWLEATRVLLVSVFFNTLLPGLIVGDALRVVYLGKKYSGQKPE